MPEHKKPELRRTIGASQLFTLAFGSIVGAGWVVGVGQWLNLAGPAGTTVAFIIGGAMMIFIGLCYGEIAAAIPLSGGELAYAYAIFGIRTSFAVGWFLALAFVVTTIFEALTSTWLIGSLLPGALGPVLYYAFGEAIRPGTLVIGLGGTALITVLNYIGVRPAVTTQDILTYTKIGIAVLLIGFGFLVGSPSNLEPLFQHGPRGIWGGVSGVLLTTPFWLSGFNLVAQVMEEKRSDTPMHRVGGMVSLSIATSTVFYILIALACAFVTPWGNLVTADLPAAKAFELAFHSTVVARIVLLVALLGTITVWNGCAIAATRMLFALGRAHMISSEVGRLHPRYHTPTAAVLFVGVCTALGVLLGRRAISPVINIASATYAVAYVVVSVALIRLRATHPLLARPFRVPGGVPTMVLGVLASLGFLGLALEGPWADSHGNIPPEWIAIIVWSVLGVVAWMVGRDTRGMITPAARRAIILGELSSAVKTVDARGGVGVEVLE